MEQIIRSHNAGEEPEGMQTLDRDRDQSEGGGENSRSREEGNRRRQHKRSILKQEGRRGKEEASLLRETSSVRTKSGNKEAKVKFAGSLQRNRGGRNGERNRRLVVRGPTYLLQLPWGYQPVSQPHHLYELQLHQRL